MAKQFELPDMDDINGIYLRLQGLDALNQQLQAKVEELTRERADYTTNDEFEALAQSTAANIDLINKRVARLTQSAAQGKVPSVTDVNQLNIDLNGMLAKVDQIEALVQRVDEHEQRLNDIDQKLAEQQGSDPKYDELREMVAQLQRDMDTALAASSRAEAAATAANTKADAVDVRVTGLDTRVTEAEKWLDGLAGDEEGLGIDESGKSTVLSGIRNRLEELDGRTTVLGKGVAELKNWRLTIDRWKENIENRSIVPLFVWTAILAVLGLLVGFIFFSAPVIGFFVGAFIGIFVGGYMVTRKQKKNTRPTPSPDRATGTPSGRAAAATPTPARTPGGTTASPTGGN